MSHLSTLDETVRTFKKKPSGDKPCNVPDTLSTLSRPRKRQSELVLYKPSNNGLKSSKPRGRGNSLYKPFSKPLELKHGPPASSLEPLRQPDGGGDEFQKFPRADHDPIDLDGGGQRPSDSRPGPSSAGLYVSICIYMYIYTQLSILWYDSKYKLLVWYCSGFLSADNVRRIFYCLLYYGVKF